MRMKKRRREKDERINQMDDAANLAFLVTKGSLGDTTIDLAM